MLKSDDETILFNLCQKNVTVIFASKYTNLKIHYLKNFVTVILH